MQPSENKVDIFSPFFGRDYEKEEGQGVGGNSLSLAPQNKILSTQIKSSYEVHNEDLSLAPHMQRAATAAFELKGRKTVLIEPMQGSECGVRHWHRQQGWKRVEMRADTARAILADAAVVKRAGALFRWAKRKWNRGPSRRRGQKVKWRAAWWGAQSRRCVWSWAGCDLIVVIS